MPLNLNRGDRDHHYVITNSCIPPAAFPQIPSFCLRTIASHSLYSTSIMSSYDDAPIGSSEDIITPSQFKESMRLVRLQIAIPISVLIAMGANLVCALAIKPGLGVSTSLLRVVLGMLRGSVR